MITKKWQPYPTYKDSGVEWLGEVPEHWEVKRLKFLITESLKYGANESAQLEDKDCPRFIRITDITEDGLLKEDTFRSLPKDIAKPFILKTGDILFARSGATFGKSFMYREQWGIACHAGYLIRARLKLAEALPEFVSYFANSSVYWDWISSIFIQATIQNVSAEKYANLWMGVPDIQEQQKIAEFLDQETSKIDKLITKKERLIELLKEKRTALISHAVTKGLNPDVPMKDSGVEWLGKIPEHWELRHLRRIVKKFVDYRGATPEKVSNGIPLITARNIKNAAIDFSLSQEFIKEEDYDNWMVRGFPEKGDVVVTTEAPLGESAQIIDTNIALAQRVILLKAQKNKITNEYLKYHFVSTFGQGELWSKGTGSTAIGIKASHFKGTLVLVPRLEEQQKIAQFLDRETSKIDNLITKTRTSIDHLKEYRTALISAAVTGKIDVREH
jgi:type I restriction enzyme S subunit